MKVSDVFKHLEEQEARSVKAREVLKEMKEAGHYCIHPEDLVPESDLYYLRINSPDCQMRTGDLESLITETLAPINLSYADFLKKFEEAGGWEKFVEVDSYALWDEVLFNTTGETTQPPPDK